MDEKIRRKQMAILRLLRDANAPLGSSRITEQLTGLGYEISERTVRFHLQLLDEEGFTRNLGRRGREITAAGIAEVEAAGIMEKVGFLSAKIDQMTYRMSFNPERLTGSVVINVTFARAADLLSRLHLVQKVFADGYAMGRLLTLLPAGERIGSQQVPQGHVGIGTVCSITLNGVLLHYGIPTCSRFGGLLELQQRKPTRFVEIIMYDGTSVDPLEVFIRSGMTDYVGAVQTGSGRIGAGFREFPADSRDHVAGLAAKLDEIGLGGFMLIGQPGQPLLDIPVSEGRFGAVVIGGLNPVAILEETGNHVHSRALAGLIDFTRLFPYTELETRLAALS